MKAKRNSNARICELVSGAIKECYYHHGRSERLVWGIIQKMPHTKVIIGM